MIRGNLARENEVINKLEQDLSVANGQRDLLGQQLAVVQPTLSAGSQFNYWQPSNEAEELESRIIVLKARLHLLRSRYTDKHPEVLNTQRQLDELLRIQAERQKAPPG